MRSFRLLSPRPLLVASLVALAALLPVHGGSPAFRVETLVPAGQPGAWDIVIATAARADKLRDRLAFRTKDGPASAKIEAAGERTLRVHLSAPAAARRLEAGFAGAKGFEPVAALDLAPSDPAAAPFDDWTIYHVYVATFRDGDRANDGEIRGWKDARYAGGDLLGVIQSLDYIRQLDVNAIWLSPVFSALSSHGYDVTNYYRVADAVGVAGDAEASLAVFRRLVREAHDRGLRVILDVPLNHASRQYQFPAGDPEGLKPKSTGPQQPEEKLWESWNSGYRYWNFGDEPTRRFLVGVALHWLVDEGADGLRLDYVRGAPHEFWARLYAAVKAAKPGAFLLGEAWMDGRGPELNAAEIATYARPAPGGGPQFDALFGFTLQDIMVDVFARGGHAAQLEDWLQATEALDGAGVRTAHFLDNHDTARFMDLAGDRRRLLAAAGFLASLSGPVVLFYGTETGLSGSQAKLGFTDSGRIPMPWDSLDLPLVGQVRSILAARRGHAALARGAHWPVMADGTTLVFAKVGTDEAALVGVNLSPEPREIVLDPAPYFAAGEVPRSIVGNSAVAVGSEPRRLRWTLPPLSTSIVAGSR